MKNGTAWIWTRRRQHRRQSRRRLTYPNILTEAWASKCSPNSKRLGNTALDISPETSFWCSLKVQFLKILLLRQADISVFQNSQSFVEIIKYLNGFNMINFLLQIWSIDSNMEWKPLNNTNLNIIEIFFLPVLRTSNQKFSNNIDLRKQDYLLLISQILFFKRSLQITNFIE